VAVLCRRRRRRRRRCRWSLLTFINTSQSKHPENAPTLVA
jgi:hypothetical protein